MEEQLEKKSFPGESVICSYESMICRCGCEDGEKKRKEAESLRNYIKLLEKEVTSLQGVFSDALQDSPALHEAYVQGQKDMQGIVCEILDNLMSHSRPIHEALGWIRRLQPVERTNT